MWGGRAPFQAVASPPPLEAAPDPEPVDEGEGATIADLAGLACILFGTVALCVGIGWAAGPGWGLAAFGVVLIGLGVTVGLTS